MRDPMSWAVPVFRAFGVPVKVHVFFFVITLGLFLRQVSLPGNVVWWGDVFLFTVVMLFGVVVVHEFGHCFGGRAVGGEANEILIWPLGGLAFVHIPQNPRALIVTIAAGPAVHPVMCLVAAGAMAASGYLPNVNPLSNPYTAEVKNYRDGRLYTSEYGLNLYSKATGERLKIPADVGLTYGKAAETREIVERNGCDWAVAPTGVVWLQRFFWLNLVQLLFNLLPAYPLDGGQLLQGFVWARSGYRQGVTIAAYSGFVVGLLFLVASIAANEALLMGLGLFMFYSSAVRLHALDADEGAFGYDFSAGYTSLERDDPAPARPKRPGYVRRWLQARAARRLQREHEQRQRDEERFDELLGKVHRTGQGSLTDEERRFMERVSARYRNRS